MTTKTILLIVVISQLILCVMWTCVLLLTENGQVSRVVSCVLAASLAYGWREWIIAQENDDER